MGEIVNHTDLSSEDPGLRANPEIRQERLEAHAEVSLAGASMSLRAWFNSESPFSRVLLAITLALCGCVCGGTLTLMGAPLWAAAIAIAGPFGLYLWLSRRPRPRRQREAAAQPVSAVVHESGGPRCSHLPGGPRPGHSAGEQRLGIPGRERHPRHLGHSR
jgi:hypothetical protein